MGECSWLARAIDCHEARFLRRRSVSWIRWPSIASYPMADPGGISRDRGWVNFYPWRSLDILVHRAGRCSAHWRNSIWRSIVPWKLRSRKCRMCLLQLIYGAARDAIITCVSRFIGWMPISIWAERYWASANSKDDIWQVVFVRIWNEFSQRMILRAKSLPPPRTTDRMSKRPPLKLGYSVFAFIV